MDYESDARPDYDNGDDQTSTMEHDTSTVTNGNPLESDEKTQGVHKILLEMCKIESISRNR